MYEDLTDMKEEDRPENIMDHQALGYSDEQILRIAAYYAGFPEDAGGSGDDKPEDGALENYEYEEEDEEDEKDEENEED